MKIQRLLALLALLAAVVVLTVVMGAGPQTGSSLPGSSPDNGGSSAATEAPASNPVASTGAASEPAANPSDLPEVNASELPPEARQTLALIAKGGPYPYSRDGVNFGNFERMLPRKSSGYYREYTVRTPGESDRGARRIIVGMAGEKYYTADHYNSFVFIVEGK